jgi:hypothetical protein
MQASLSETNGVQFNQDGNFIGSGRCVLHEVQGVREKLFVFGISDIISVPVIKIAIDEVNTVSANLASPDQFSTITFRMRDNKVYEFVFTEGRMTELIDLLQHRKVIIRQDTAEEVYASISGVTALRDAFIVGRPAPIKTSFSKIELFDRVDSEDYITKLDQLGRLTVEKFKELKILISRNGLSESTMPVVWCYLLGVLQVGSTTLEQSNQFEFWTKSLRKGLKFIELLSPVELLNFPLLRDSLRQIDMDVARTDTESQFYAPGSGNREKLARITRAALKTNLQVGYCQGMLDCASVFLQVNGGNEVMAFSCYNQFILLYGNVYGTDLGPLKSRINKVLSVLRICKPDLEKVLQTTKGYLVAQPWILMWLKRQFPYSVVLCLWTMILNKTYGRDSLFYIIAAIFIAKAHYVLVIDNVSDGSIFEIYRDVSDIPLNDITTIAFSCRRKYIAAMRQERENVK